MLISGLQIAVGKKKVAMRFCGSINNKSLVRLDSLSRKASGKVMNI